MKINNLNALKLVSLVIGCLIFFQITFFILLLPAMAFNNQNKLIADLSTDPLTQKSAKSKTVLFGGIEHSEKLKPLPKMFKKGQSFVGISLKPELAAADLYWFQLPKWAGGTWQTQSETITTSTKLNAKLNEPLKCESTVPIGSQLDNKGDLWDCFIPNIINMANSNSGKIYSTDISCVQLSINNQKYVMKTVSRTNQVDNDQKIVQALQYEAIDIYTLNQANQLRDLVSVTWYDQDGNYLYNDERVKYFTLIAPFKPINEYDQINLNASFIEYLQNHGLQNLIPQLHH